MKARVKATGEIIEVNKVTSYTEDFKALIYYKDASGFSYKEEQLDFEDLTQGKSDVKEKSLPKDEPDYWEKLKHQYAGMAMQGILSNNELYREICKSRNLQITIMEYATALVNKLKEESECKEK